MLQKPSRNFYLGLIFIFLISLLSFTWFKKDLIYSFGDFPFNFSPKNNIERFFYVWDERLATGLPNFHNFPNLLPYELFLYLWQSLNLPMYLGQRFLIWILFFASGLSMYILILTVSKDEKRYLWATVSGLFYMMNPFSLVIVWGTLAKLIFFYPFAPLSLAVFIRLLKEKKKTFKYFILFILSTLPMITSFSVLTFAIDFWFIIGGFGLYYFLVENKTRVDRLRTFGITLLLGFFWVLINSFWLIPSLSEASFLAKVSAEKAETSPAAILVGSSRAAYLSNTFRLFGYNVFQEKFMGVDPFFSYAKTYLSSPFSFIGFLIPLGTFSALIFLSRKSKPEERASIMFFYILSLLSLFFYKGVNRPFKDLYIKLAEFSPFFGLAFRNPIDKIGPLVCLVFSPLFGYSIVSLSTSLKRGRKIIFLFSIFFLVFLIYLHPFWQRKVFKEGGTIYRPSLVKVPESYWQASKWLRTQKEYFRIFPIPPTSMYGVPLDWEYGYDSSDPIMYIFDKPTFYIDISGEDTVEKKIWNVLYQGKLTDENIVELRKLLSYTRVKYVLLHEDIAQNYFSIDRPVFLRTRENLAGEYFVLEKTFGKLKFYRVKDNFLLPTIFLSKSEENDLMEDLESIIEPQYLRINPTKWEVDIQNNSEPFSLIFLTKYDPRWKVYFDFGKKEKNFVEEITETWFLQPLDRGKHQSVFGYANLWRVTPPVNTDNLRIIIEYTPQRFFYFGILISLTAFIGLLITALIKLGAAYRPRNGKRYNT